MNRKTLVIADGVLVLGAFLLGFVPHSLKVGDLNNQLGALRQQLSSEREKSQIEELALLCGYAYVETSGITVWRANTRPSSSTASGP